MARKTDLIEVEEGPRVESKPEEPRVVNIDALVDEEVARLMVFYKDREFRNALKPKWPVEEYVRRVVDAHLPMIIRFNGWRWHSGPLGALGIEESTMRDLMADVIYAFQDTEVPLRQWSTLGDQQLCMALGCHLPFPIYNYDLFRARTWEPATKGVKEQQFEYASRTFARIRAGQKVASAVLAEIKKKFSGSPAYVMMWERIFERLGQAWGSMRNVGITMTVAPSDIMRFGHLGENSCFRTGGAHEVSKLNIPLIQNSFGLMFYRDGVNADNIPAPHELRQNAIAGRAWGVLDLENEGAVLTNMYLTQWVAMRPSIIMALSDLFGFQNLTVFEKNFGSLNDLARNGYAYVNGDCHIVAHPDRSEQVHEHIAARVEDFLTAKLQHKKIGCNSCGTYHTDGAVTPCACGAYSCASCRTNCACCDREGCQSCTGRSGHTCGGCSVAMCTHCVRAARDSQCRICRTVYCPNCVGDAMQSCGVEGCTRRVCVSTRCSQSCCVGGTRMCTEHAQELLRRCDRCRNTVHMDHVTRCSGCFSRRCDNCRQDGEDVTPRSLCNDCQTRGVQAPAEGGGTLDPAIEAAFGVQLQQIDREVLGTVRDRLRRFEWNAEPVQPAAEPT
jgi:hypothetical protein